MVDMLPDTALETTNSLSRGATGAGLPYPWGVPTLTHEHRQLPSWKRSDFPDAFPIYPSSSALPP